MLSGQRAHALHMAQHNVKALVIAVLFQVPAQAPVSYTHLFVVDCRHPLPSFPMPMQSIRLLCFLKALTFL